MHAWLAAHYGGVGEKPPIDEGLDRFCAWLDGQLPVNPLADFELEYCAEFEHGILTGHMDYCDASGDSAVIIDWKTGSGAHLPPIEEDMQMAAYALLSHVKHPKDVVHVYRVLVDQLRIERVVYTTDMIDEFRVRLESLIRLVASPTPPLVPGPHCERCFSSGQCPQFLRQSAALIEYPYAGGGLVSQEQVVRGLRAVKAAEEILDTFKSAARDWVAMHGPVRDGDYEWRQVVMRRGRKLALGADDVIIMAGQTCCEDCQSVIKGWIKSRLAELGDSSVVQHRWCRSNRRLVVVDE